MAMLNRKQRPLPSGGGVRRVTKPTSNHNELALAIAPKTSASQALKQLPVGIHFGHVRANNPPFDPATAASNGGSGGSGGGSKEWLPTWNYEYGKSAWEGVPFMLALANLLCNARVFTPLGKKFMPDPQHDGKSLVSPTQRPAPMCQVKWDNVVDFETALSLARSEAISRSANSQQSRGGQFGERQIVRRDPELGTNTSPSKAKPSLEKEKTSTTKPASSLGEAANDNGYATHPKKPSPVEVKMKEWIYRDKKTARKSGPPDHEEVVLPDEYVITSRVDKGFIDLSYPSTSKRFRPSSDYDDVLDPWDSEDEPWLSETFNSGAMFTEVDELVSAMDMAFLNISISASMQLDRLGYYQLSPCILAEKVGNEVWLTHHDPETQPEGLTRTLRIKDLEFLYKLESAIKSFPLSDNVLIEEDTMLSDYAANSLFDMMQIGGEFSAMTESQLVGLWLYQDHANLQFKGQCPLNPSFENPLVTADEIGYWHDYYYEKTGERWRGPEDLRSDHRRLLLSVAKMDPVLVPEPNKPHTMLYPLPKRTQRSLPSIVEKAVASVSQQYSRDDLSKYMAYWVRGDDNIQYQRWLLKNADPEEYSEVEETGWTFQERLQRTLSFMESVPVFTRVIVPKKVPVTRRAVRKLRGWANSFKSWLNEPVLSFDYSDAATEEEVNSFSEEVDDTVVKRIADRVVRDKTAHDDSYDLDWLENLTGESVNRNYPCDPVSMAIKAVSLDKPEEVYSESGIYLGKKVTIPRSKHGLVLLGNTEGIDSTNHISSSTLDLSNVEDLGKDRLDIPFTK